MLYDRDELWESCVTSKNRPPQKKFRYDSSGDVFRASDAGKCPRALTYEFRNGVRDLSPFWGDMGAAVEKFVARAIKEYVPKVNRVYTDTPTTDYAPREYISAALNLELDGVVGMVVRARPDALVSFSNLATTLVEVKGIYKRPDEPKLNHYRQVQATWRAFPNIERAVLLYVTRSYGTPRAFAIRYDEEEFNDIVRMFQKVRRSVKGSTYPECTCGRCPSWKRK